MKGKKIDQFIDIKEDTFFIDVFDLEQITKIAYGTPIEMGLVQKNSEVFFDIDGKLTNQEDYELSEAKINEVLECSKYHLVLNDLSRKGLLKNGKYKIKAFW